MATVASMLVLEDRMTRTLNTIDRAAQSANSTFQALSTQINTLSTQMNRIQNVNFNQLNNNLSNVNNTSRQLTNNYTQANNTLQNMIGTVGKLGLALGGIAGIKNLIGLSDETAGIRARLSLLVDDGGSLEELEKQVFDSANRVGAEYAQIADIVGRVGNQARNAFGSNDEVVAFAELLEKTFSNAGADATAIESTMYNLTQSLSTGKLLGNDYRIIKQNAPQMIQYLRDFYGVTAEGLDKMVTAGQVTASDIKNAMFNAAEDINTTFNNMPISWGNAMARIKNHALKAFDPILRKINEVANSENFTNFMDSIVSVLYTIGNIAVQVFTGISNVIGFVRNNLGSIIPLLTFILGIMGAYKLGIMAITFAQKINNTVTAISTFISTIHRRALQLQAIAHMGVAQSLAVATAMQLGFNRAIYMSPIFWIIGGIILFISVLSAVIIHVKKAQGETVNAIGVVVGVIFAVGANILNFIIGILNAIISIFDGVINTLIGTIELFLNLAIGGFNDFGGKVANIMGKLVSFVLDIGKAVTSVWDAIFGTNATKTLEGWQKSVNSWGKNEKAITLERVDHRLNTIDVNDAYNKGYGIFSGIGTDELTGGTMGDYSKYLNNLNSAIGTDSTGGKAVKTTTDDKLLTDEDIQLLLDVATRDYKLNYQQITPNVTITFGDVRETADVDNILDQVADRLEEIYDGNLEVATV